MSWQRAEERTEHPAAPEPEELARLEVELEEARHRLELAREISERRARDCERLEREVAVLRSERDAFQRQFEERNHLLAVILSSRSWRWTQALRRIFGRV